jgi:ribonuclease E
MPADSDDDWAELARELARDKLPPLPEATALESDFGEGVSPPEPAEGSAEEGVDSILDGADVPADGEGQPGTGRKRRRRRRRRRRGGPDQPVEAGAAEAEESEGDEAGEPAESEATDADAAPSEIGGSDESDYESDLAIHDTQADEDAGGELLRDLIANWNVPSWDDVVAGLYRPER